MTNTRIDRFVVERKLRQGDSGPVYLAFDPLLERSVAIHLLRNVGGADMRERFLREARAAAALDHPNITTVYDAGDASAEHWFITTEFVRGETLAKIIGRHAPVPLREKLRWIDELCAAVGYAHELGVLHQDVKPANLVIDDTGQLKVLDFGVARIAAWGTTEAVETSGPLPDPRYAAPERLLGGPLDARSDLFSIAAVSYELLSYRKAFPGKSFYDITARVLNDDPVPLMDIVSEIDPELARIVAQGLRKSADQRFADVPTLRLALSRVRRRLEEGAERPVQPTRTAEAPNVVERLPRTLDVPRDDTADASPYLGPGLIAATAVLIAGGLLLVRPSSTIADTSGADALWRILAALGVAVCGAALVVAVVRHVIEFVAAVWLVDRLRKKG